MPLSAEFDDPEDFPEDEEEGTAPGDPPVEFDNDDERPNVVHETLDWERRLTPDVRERRRRRVEDFLKTREYTQQRKAVLQEERGGRFS